MHFYWRIQQDLASLGEMLVFHNPGLIRSYTEWAQKNAFCLAMIEDLHRVGNLKPVLN